ncbi:MAG: hypothetical protein M3290_08760 [Actinomycetota bacterium]|nr:hypothetical protein [Actinomycetota bacterium]
MLATRSDRPDSPLRLTASKAEARAAQWCAARLSSCGYDVHVDTFSARRSIAPSLVADLVLSAIGAAFLGFAPIVSVVLGVVAIVDYARTCEGRTRLGWRGDRSRNVIGATTSPPSVVVIAGMDGVQGWSAWHARLGPALRSATIALHVVLFAVPAIGSGVWVFGEHDPARLEVVGAALAMALVAACAWIATHDTAEGVTRDTPLEVALRIGQLRLPEVWIAFVGATGSGSDGMTDFLDRWGERVGSAALLNLEQIGAGRAIAIEQEGVVKARRANGALVQAAEDAGAEIADWRLIPTDGGVALARHFRAMTLMLGDGNEPDPAGRLFGIAYSVIDKVRRR